MPTPPKTSRSEIVTAAQELIAERGVDALTMQAVADRVGVRGPSLYKYFADRAALLREVEQTVVTDLEKVLAAADNSPDDKSVLQAMAGAYREFARKSPAEYALIFRLRSGDPASEAARRRALQPALKRLESYLGESHLAFIRARVLMSFLHGFVSIESIGAFRFGGNIDDAFSSGIEILLTKPEKRRSI